MVCSFFLLLTSPLLLLASPVYLQLTLNHPLSLAAYQVLNQPLQLAGLGFLPAEIAHLQDVVRWLAVVRLLWLIIVIIIGVGWWTRRRLTQAALTRAAKFTLGLGIGFGLLILLFWNQVFISFHRLLFPQGNWAFPADSLLIITFPEPFWQLTFFVYLALVLGLCLLVLLCERF